METKFAAAYGTLKLAEIESGGFVDPAEDAADRERAALENLIAIRSPHAAGILGKIEIVAEHVRDHRDTYHRLVAELDACTRELSAANVDLSHVADALAVVARRLEREGLDEAFVRLLRSAAIDADTLAVSGGAA